jgi:hypothetical protein
MRDASYVLAGYGITGAALLLYRLQLARRTRRAHRLVEALSGRSANGRRPRR